MTKLRVQCFSISLDGYGAGASQSVENPLGVGGEQLHDWFVPTSTFQRMVGKQGGTSGVDDDFAARGIANIGAWILGRNMFGPIRGEWPDDAWKGWWGDNPPYHHPVFVLTHYPHEPIPMEGGTTFHFVTDGIESALEKARVAANGKDIRIGGGASTIQQYLRAGLVDEMHIAIAPILLGGGERLFDNLGPDPIPYECVQLVSSPAAVHARFVRK
jgi:dihydrofolate reductase